jgi:hypothetical protein
MHNRFGRIFTFHGRGCERSLWNFRVSRLIPALFAILQRRLVYQLSIRTTDISAALSLARELCEAASSGFAHLQLQIKAGFQAASPLTTREVRSRHRDWRNSRQHNSLRVRFAAVATRSATSFRCTSGQ